MPDSRAVFFVSDSTGITAEMMGYAVITQFSAAPFEYISVPFVDSTERAQELRQRIDTTAQSSLRPIVFSTLVNAEVRAIVRGSRALFLDCFDAFIGPLESELRLEASREIGITHGLKNPREYQRRIDSVNFALAHDDGSSTRGMEHAEVILVGVSRAGKTPTCLYMALQFGVRAANYPLTPEDLERESLPPSLQACRDRLYGLTIDPSRLQQIRSERRPGSSYASQEVCHQEVRRAEALMRAHGIPFIDTTKKSIEEISAFILQKKRLGGFR